MNKQELDINCLTGIDGDVIDDIEISEEELEGLTADWRGRKTQLKRRIAPIFNKKIARVKRSEIVKRVRQTTTKGQTLIFAKRKQLDLDTQKAMTTGNLKFKDQIFYIRRDISSKSGMIDLIESKIDRDSGVTNLEKGKLPDFVNMMLQRLELNVADSTDITTKTAALAPMTNAIDKALYNGEIELLVGNRSIFRIPVNSVLSPDRKNPEGEKNGVNFFAPEMITERTDINIRLHLVGTIAAPGRPAAKYFIIEAKLIGDGIGSKR